MRASIFASVLAAAAVCGGLLLAVWLVLRPAGAALRTAEFSSATLTPDADGLDDILRIRYELARPALVSIFLLDAAGTRYTFRSASQRSSGSHAVLFSGIVDGFALAGETGSAEILARVLPAGDYTWVVAAAAPGGDSERRGTLSILSQPAPLPDVRGFSVSPLVFTPNRDGISDRVWINAYLAAPAKLEVSLIDDAGAGRPIPEREGTIAPGAAGLHTFEYEGGVDLGVNPPPDGTYSVVALAQDALGQRVRAQGKLAIELGGVPRAEIVNAAVSFEPATIVQGEALNFSLTVENYGTAPLRTTGPAPGYAYKQNENANTLGWFEESGAWRVGLDCDTCIRDYPWRWALGTPEELTKIGDYYYLMPGQRVTISSSVLITDVPERNPLYFWAGLIHEDVEISNVNNRVDPFFVTIVPRN